MGASHHVAPLASLGGTGRNAGCSSFGEATIASRLEPGRLTGAAGYTWLDATFRSEETIDGTDNSTDDAGRGPEGTIDIEAGDLTPLIPQHLFKALGTFRSHRSSRSTSI